MEGGASYLTEELIQLDVARILLKVALQQDIDAGGKDEGVIDGNEANL